jgi:DNA-binding HxlR family transcriptional regulator
MTLYGSFCPIAKATELIGERWTLLILRELLMGSTRFSELQRGLAKISPALLTKRLKQLEAGGILVRRRISGRRGHEYRLTEAGRELYPVIDSLAVWGMRWTQARLGEDELDIELLMMEISRGLDTAHLPDGETVICFSFKPPSANKNYWLVIANGKVDLCDDDPGKDVDLYLTSDVRTLIEIWTGKYRVQSAIADNAVSAIGASYLTKNIAKWFGPGRFAHVRPAEAARLRWNR